MAKIFATALESTRLVPPNMPSFYSQQPYKTHGATQSIQELLSSPPPSSSSTFCDPVSPTFLRELPSIYNNSKQWKSIKGIGIYWFNIIDEMLSKRTLFTIVYYYYCICTVPLKGKLVKQDQEELMN